MQLETFLSCDWGTSAFRLRVIRTTNLEVLAEERSAKGTAATYHLWKSSETPESNRLPFYRNIIAEHIDSLEEKLQVSLEGVPLIISGMASSSIGMVEVPYKALPFSMDGSDLQTYSTEPAPDFNHPLIIISGVKTEEDVMRGEETKLVGCSFNTIPPDEAIYVFPGTHSKHVTVKNGQAVNFKTYMTGEFFEVLSQKSILAASVEEVKNIEDEANRKSFGKGVEESLSSNLLHACFMVRTNELFKKRNKQESYCYLSGLLIGTELKELLHQKTSHITFVCHEKLRPYYEEALRILKLWDSVQMLPADDMLIKGQYLIYRNHNSK